LPVFPLREDMDATTSLARLHPRSAAPGGESRPRRSAPSLPSPGTRPRQVREGAKRMMKTPVVKHLCSICRASCLALALCLVAPLMSHAEHARGIRTTVDFFQLSVHVSSRQTASILHHCTTISCSTLRVNQPSASPRCVNQRAVLCPRSLPQRARSGLRRVPSASKSDLCGRASRARRAVLS
jgi:hypothetical protein